MSSRFSAAAAAQQRDVDQRLPAPPRGVPEEQRDQDQAGQHRDAGARVAKATVTARFGHAVEEDGDAGGEQQQPPQVEPQVRPRAGLRLGVRQQPPGGEHGSGADGQVDEEDPAPAGRVDDRAAEQRAEHGSQQHRHADHTHHPSHPLRPRGLGQDGLADGQDHPGAEPLRHPEGDQRWVYAS
jgi:hypothetical protein